MPVDIAIDPVWLASEVPDLEALPAAGGLRFRGQLRPNGQEVLLFGQIEGSLDTTCARCLEPAKVVLAADVTQLYGKVSPLAESLDEDDADIEAIDGDEVDIGPRLRDEIVLGVPPSPLCREDCRGLCPVCGGNRNLDPCECEQRQRAAASPFAALKT